MSQFIMSDKLTKDQRRIIESFGNKPVKKIKPPKEPMIYKPRVYVPDPTYMTIREVADLLRVSTLTLKRWEKRGEIKSVRINKRGDRRYLRSYIEELLK